MTTWRRIATLGAFLLASTLAVTAAEAAGAPTTTQLARGPAVRQALEKGAFLSTKDNAQRGMNASSFVTVGRPGGKGTLEAIVKPAAFDGKVLHNVPLATQPTREAAVSTLAEHLGVPFVPVTVTRPVDGGRLASVQLVVRGAPEAGKLGPARPDAQLDRESAEKLRVFDFVTGNVDRHGRNLLVEDRGGKLYPVAIDNGMTFPRGAMSNHFYWPYEVTRTHQGPLLPTTQRFIQSIDETSVARVLKSAGIEQDAVEHTLRRIEVLKKDPSVLELPRRTPTLVLHPWLAQQAHRREATFLMQAGGAGHKESISREARERIAGVVSGVYASSSSSSQSSSPSAR